jgi:hypothetical protein
MAHPVGVGDMNIHIGDGFALKDGERFNQIPHNIFFQKFKNDLSGLFNQRVLRVK